MNAPAADERHRFGERQPLDSAEPVGSGGVTGRRRHPDPCNDAGHHRHKDDAQILHEGDEADIGPESFGHERHGGCRSRTGTPDRRRSGQHAPARQQQADQGARRDDGEDHGREQRPVLGHRTDDFRRDGTRDHAADDRLRHEEGDMRNAQRSLTGCHDDRRDHGAEQERRRQPDGFQNRHEDAGQEEHHRPLDAPPPATERPEYAARAPCGAGRAALAAEKLMPLSQITCAVRIFGQIAPGASLDAESRRLYWRAALLRGYTRMP